MGITPRMGADSGVPGLAIAISREALIEVLSEHLPECRDVLQILDARLVDLQYTPGSSALVLWRVKVLDLESQHTRRQLISVKALARGAAEPSEPEDQVARYRRQRARKDLAPELPFRTPWLFIRSVGVLFCAYPLDPLLPTLLDVADPQAMKVALHRAWQPRGVRVRRVRVHTLSYTPEARAAIRYEVLAEDKDSGLPEIRRLVGKLDVGKSPSRLFADHWSLWRRTHGLVSIAPPVGYLSVARLSLQEFLTGTRLSDHAGTGAFVGYVRETARTIAGVHALTLPLTRTRGLEKEMKSVNRWVHVLAQLRPAQAGRVQSLGRRLASELAARLRLSGTVHGDFHLANVMVDDHGVTLVDWDQMAHGDPMVDVGRVLASLRVSSLRIHRTLDGLASVEEDFLATYLARTRDDEGRARLFEAVALLVAAAAPFRLQREGWETSADLMIDEVQRMLDRSLAGPRLAVGAPPAPEPAVAFKERCGWALDRLFAQALLVPLVHAAYGADIEVTECLPKLKERRRGRMLVRWAVKGYRGTERWRGSLAGVGFPDDSGRGRLRRLEIMHEVLAGHPRALRLPRPIGHLDPISMVVFEPPAGESLEGLLGTAREGAVLRHTADALAAFHALAVDLGKGRETVRTLESARRRVARLRETGHASAAHATTLLERLEPALAAVRERRAPTVIGMHPRHLRIDASDVAVSLFDDVLLADPLVSVGDLLAELAVGALERGHSTSASAQLRHAYANAAGCQDCELVAFTALALLSRACRRGVKRPADKWVAPIIEYAASLQAGKPG